MDEMFSALSEGYPPFAEFFRALGITLHRAILLILRGLNTKGDMDHTLQVSYQSSSERANDKGLSCCQRYAVRIASPQVSNSARWPERVRQVTAA